MRDRVMRGVVAVLALAGLVVSVLALRIHTEDPSIAPPCAVSAHWDCGTVNHGNYSVFPRRRFGEAPGTAHVPVAAVGIVGYGLLVLAAALGWWRIAMPMAALGFGTAAYLSYVEANVIKTWCIYCVWSQGIIAAVLVGTVVAMVMQWRSGRAGGGLSRP